MELKLEVVLSSSIKRKKPWPRFCWLGQEKEAVFLLDDKRLSEINMVSGRTKKRTPKLQPLLNNVVTMGSSSNALCMWLCGLLKTGKIFLWNRDKDLLKTTETVPEVADFISCVQGSPSRLSLQVSDGRRVLLSAVTGQVFLWQCADVRDLTGVRDCTVKGNWTQIQPSNDTILPTSQDKEACVHSLFVKTEALGDVCLSTFVFTSENKLIISCLKINWGENQEKMGPISYNVKWATKTLLMPGLKPACQPVKSRGALVTALSPDGQILAIVLNQRQPQATQVLFVSTVNFVSVSRSLGGCGSKKMAIPSKYIRSYWVGCVSWSAGGLFLACVLKRGSLLMLARLGGLLTLSTCGCNVDFGPAQFLPLHPLVTYRPPSTAEKGEASLSSSSLSVRDVMRQRYSVTWHPQLHYFIVSDGYMATVVRVLDKISPALLLITLLKDTTADLKEASQFLEKSQNHVKLWLDSVSSLNMEKSLLELGPTNRPKTTEGSTLPIFLQDQGTMGTPREILDTVQTFFEDDSDVDGVPVGSHVKEGGRLEFASMFDTLHAMNTHYEQFLDSDSEQRSTVGKKMAHYDLEKMESKLLTAWAFCVSLGSFIESKSFLLKHATKCTVRFAALLQLMSNSMVHSENEAIYMLDFLKKLLHFTPWERANSERPQFVGIMVELCKSLVQLVLTPYTDSYLSRNCEISSHNLTTALQILQMFSRSLDQTYTLQQRSVWSSVGKESSQPLQLWSLDIHSVPLLQAETKEETNLKHSTLPGLVQPSRRLHGIWRWLYTIAQKYMKVLEHLRSCDNWEREKQQLVVIMCKIQTALQASGERLEEDSRLLSYTGEHLFLSGFYTESSEVWYSQLLETCKKSGKSTVFQEKRLCLALLYSLLSQYRLQQAQELGDHMACLILRTNRHQKNDGREDIVTEEEYLQCSWLSKDVSTDAAYAVVQTLGRFMASYFSNQALYILPPHNVDVLPPIHIPHASSVGRLVPLCQEEVSKAVRQQQLSEIWTVEYAQDLLLLGGLLPESVWLAYHLGDWKAAMSLSQAYSSYCKQHFNFTVFNRRELVLPKDLEPASILQAEINCLLGDNGDSKEPYTNQSFSDPVGEDWGLLHVSMQDILKASVMAGVDAVSSPLSSLLDKAKDLCSCLTAIVPTAFYLPSPPLYCPQPSPNSQDPAGSIAYHTELVYRQKISENVQKLLLLLRSANCCHPAAQWYLSQLRRARHILHKMKKKYSYHGACQEEKSFPDGLLKFINRSGHFRYGPKKNIDPGTIQTIRCFRELCGLCWMLHVRDQLSSSCRKYQAERQQAGDGQTQENSEMKSRVDALQWAQRFLPFSRFLNCEEIVQDTILSLLSELPPVSLVADTLVVSFPEEVESIRVPLREKYNTIMKTLRQCNVIGAGKETGEIMMVLIQDKLRLRKKHFGRLRRHLAPLELHLWEKVLEEEDGRNKHGMDMFRQRSLGTSLSTSTLTDCGLLPLHSDTDTSEAPVCPNLRTTPARSRTKKSKIQDRGEEMKTAQEVNGVITDEGPSGDAKEKQHSTIKQPSLPSVGSWEFELEDEEYLNFLELFLSYLLEKDTADTNEIPLLKDFSFKLRERELHSLTFDVLTTLHRRQRDGHHQARKSSEPCFFRAGSCFRPVIQDPAMTSAVSSQSSLFQNQTSSTCFPQRTKGLHKGLFSHQNQLRRFSQRSVMSSPVRNALQTQQPSGNLRFCSVAPAVDLMQGLNTELEAQFPELGRLLEWMMRWADRRLLLGPHGKKRNKGRVGGGATDEGVVIRVKVSAPAVLTSLCLMERRYTALLGTDLYRTHVQVPNTQWIVAPAQVPPTNRKVDKGYSVSTITPTTVLDSNINASSVGFCAGESVKEKFYIAHGQESLQPDAPKRASSSQSHETVDVALQEEGHHTKHGHCTEYCHVYAKLLVIYVSITDRCSSVSSEVFTPGTSLKLADLENSKNQSSLASFLLKTSPDAEPQIHTTDKEESVVHDDSSKVQSSSQDPDLLYTQPQTAAPPSVSRVPDQASEVQTPQMRQRLGDDLFRLVQNINYMSLMEVLGASFTNLQLAQQNVSVAHSNSNLHTHVHNAMPPPNAQPVPPPVVTHTQPNPPSNPEYMHLHPNSTGILSGGQEMAPLSVQAGSPVRNSRNNLIPCSEGLLTTAEIEHISALPPSNSGIQNDPAPLLSGLKLLQLHPPHLPAHVSRQGSQSPQNYPHHASSSSMIKYNEQKGYARSQIHFTIEAQHQPIAVNSYSNQTRVKGQEVSLLPQTLPVLAASTPQGLRLLHVQPVSNNNITLPKLPTNTLSRPHTSHAVPMGVTPRIKLLQIEPQPKVMLPLQASLSPITPRMPEKWSALECAGDNAQVQLVRAVKSTDSNESTVFHNSNKRQMRREKLEKSAEKEITFCPNDSVIPQATSYDLPTDDNIFEEATSEPVSVVPSGPLLRGEDLLEKAFATAAELHAFASTCRRPPECHDAFTNTEPDRSLHVDKAVSTDIGTKILREEQTHSKLNVQDQQEPVEERHFSLDGRQFVHVVDLEDKLLHQDLPLSHSNHSSVCAESTTAELHVMATLRNGAVSQFSREQTNEMFHSQTSVPANHNEESVLHSPVVLEDDREGSAAESFESEAEIIRAVKTLPHTTLSDLTQQPTVWFSSQISQVDSQLTSLQRIADSLETDLSKTRMLVKTVKKLTPVSTPEKKASTGVKKTVRLSAPLEMRAPQHVSSTEQSACDSFHPQTAGSSVIHSPPRIKHDFADLSNIVADETLEETGLSDTAEILDQLVSDGFLPLNDFDWENSSTRHKSRLDQEQKGNMSKICSPLQDDKIELRMWMKKKQQERIAVYQKHRQNLRGMEHRPFSSARTVKCVTKDASLKSKREPIRVLDHFKQRAFEALNLATDHSSSLPVIQGFSDTSGTDTARPLFPLPYGTTYRVYKSSERNECPSENRRPRSAGVKDFPSDDYHKRLGIDRPVTSLPRDRLSQVTRRGMLTRSLKSNATAVEKHNPNKTKTIHRISKTCTERAVSHRDVTGLDNSGEEQDNVATGETQWDWLDDLSETGSSNISQIDWAAIERIVAEET
ncbi:ciliogenesis and planar polarity effector 1 [Eucyclogobius newberryi]|uniref:ciliogenesis and planar polarity effector 1 n=1 Tax=Eucyclogobius newberryi TaxID=166745 RepID=UPI003B5C8C99